MKVVRYTMEPCLLCDALADWQVHPHYVIRPNDPHDKVYSCSKHLAEAGLSVPEGRHIRDVSYFLVIPLAWIEDDKENTDA